MNLRILVIACLSAAVLSGCATTAPPLNFSVPNVGITNKKIDAELKSMTVTVARPDEAKGNIDLKLPTMDPWSGQSSGENTIPQLWQTALTEALNKMVVFQDESSKKVNLSVKILKLSPPSVGFSMTTETIARYEIMDRKTGDIIYAQDISSSGTTPSDFAFAAIVRVRESVSRAVQNNVSLFLQALETVDASKPMFPAANRK